MNAPMHAISPETRVIDDMARALVDGDVDLGNEQAAIMELVGQRFRGADVSAFLDDAINAARSIRAAQAKPEGMG